MDDRRAALLAWYDSHRRDLPWRRTRDPYAIWISETMLQQTRVATAIPYFERWMLRFPTFAALAQASEDEVLASWQGLGYYSRARRLLEGARWIAWRGVPGSVEEWRGVPGVGPYTAAAVGSIALGLPAPLVDGNVERVFARWHADERFGPALNRACWGWAEELLDRERPGDWNQALMELGATVCTPRAPECGRCPVSRWCAAYRTDDPTRFPVAAPKPVTREVSMWVVVPLREGCFGLRQFPPGEWWQGLWGFPTTREAPAGEFEPLGTFRHFVTRHRVTVNVLMDRDAEEGDLEWFDRSDLETLAMPMPQRRVLAMADERLSGRTLF